MHQCMRYEGLEIFILRYFCVFSESQRMPGMLRNKQPVGENYLIYHTIPENDSETNGRSGVPFGFNDFIVYFLIKRDALTALDRD